MTESSFNILEIEQTVLLAKRILSYFGETNPMIQGGYFLAFSTANEAPFTILPLGSVASEGHVLKMERVVKLCRGLYPSSGFKVRDSTREIVKNSTKSGCAIYTPKLIMGFCANECQYDEALLLCLAIKLKKLDAFTARKIANRTNNFIFNNLEKVLFFDDCS